MSVANTRPLAELADQIRQSRSEEVTLSDVVRLAEISTEAFQTFFKAMDSAVLREMREIADYITSMKEEIGTLQVNDIKNARIPSAGLELDAIVKATEKATNSIMECAEAVMGADTSDPKAYKALIDDRMMVIFEACSFQDITGQRISKVVETLKHIETRVSRFAAAVSVPDVAGPMSEDEARRSERKARLLLHGPQMSTEAIKQNEVDALLTPAAVATKAVANAAAAPAKVVAPAPAKAAPAPAKAAAAPAAPPAAGGGNSQSDIDALFA